MTTSDEVDAALQERLDAIRRNVQLQAFVAEILRGVRAALGGADPGLTDEQLDAADRAMVRAALEVLGAHGIEVPSSALRSPHITTVPPPSTADT